MIFLLILLVTPDIQLTPGATRNLTIAQICSTKWGLDERHVDKDLKTRVYVAYRVTDHSKYVIDHLVPRELGGADEFANLWPQPRTESHKKDGEERRLHNAVCAGKIALIEAQDQMRRWPR